MEEHPELFCTVGFPPSRPSRGCVDPETNDGRDQLPKIRSNASRTQSLKPRLSKTTSLAQHRPSAANDSTLHNEKEMLHQALFPSRHFGEFSRWGQTLVRTGSMLQRTGTLRKQPGNFQRLTGAPEEEAKEEEEEDFNSEEGRGEMPSTNWFVKIVLVLMLVLIIGNLLVQVVLRWGIDPQFHDSNTEEFFPEIDPLHETYADIAEEVIPNMKTWYRAQSSERATFAAAPVNRQDRISCAEFWRQAIRDTANISHTDPDLIAEWLHIIGLDEHPQVTSAVQGLLSEPQPIDHVLARGAHCAGANPALGSYLCAAREEPALRMFQQWTQDELREWLPRIMNWAMLLEALTMAADDDTSLYFAIFDYAFNGVMSKMLDAMEFKFEGDYLAFVKQKYTGIAQSGFYEAVKMMSNIPSASLSEAAQLRHQLQMNIMEAANLDRSYGLANNTHVGVALAAQTPWAGSVDEHKRVWLLGKQWVEAYNAWNFAFTTNLNVPYAMVKLLIPSVGCAAEDGKMGEDFFRRRVVSLQLTLFQVSLEFNDITGAGQRDGGKAWRNANATTALGALNRRHVQLNSPSKDQVERMLTALCNGECHGERQLHYSKSVPTDWLDDEGFRCYSGVLLWITVLVAGFGTEFFVSSFLMSSEHGEELEARMQWLQTMWLFAQFIFSLFLSIALGSALTANYTGLPFLVLGVWKFGFPETYMFFFNCFVLPHGGVDSYVPGRRRAGLPLWMWTMSGWSNALNGLGTALHHGAAAGMLCFLTTRCAQPHRCIQACCLPLILQHWFVLTRYLSKNLYLVLMLLTEAFFEWTVFSNWECSYQFSDPIRHCGAVMLVAHWLYLAAAGLSLLDGDEDQNEAVVAEADSQAPSPGRLSREQSEVSTRSQSSRPTRSGTIRKWTETMKGGGAGASGRDLLQGGSSSDLRPLGTARLSRDCDLVSPTSPGPRRCFDVGSGGDAHTGLHTSTIELSPSSSSQVSHQPEGLHPRLGSRLSATL